MALYSSITWYECKIEPVSRRGYVQHNVDQASYETMERIE